jgi:hypothetical protein
MKQAGMGAIQTFWFYWKLYGQKVLWFDDDTGQSAHTLKLTLPI